MTVNKLTLPAKANAVQSKINEIIDNTADNTLSNVSSIDSNSAVQTALDGKVSKSGDTMTGSLNITLSGDDTNNLIIKNNSIERFVTPSVQNQTRIQFVDKNNEDIGSLYYQQKTDGSKRLSQVLRDGVSNKAYSYIGYDSLGNATCGFPDTTCVDGQWVSKSVTVMSGQDLNGSTNLPYTLTDVPNDGYKYEVLLTGQATSGTTAGNAVKLEINSDAVTGGTICTAQTRTASTITSSGAVILPLTTSRKIYVLRATAFHGTGTLYLRGYRRIGTNA